jgi:hypothetical protein
MQSVICEIIAANWSVAIGGGKDQHTDDCCRAISSQIAAATNCKERDIRLKTRCAIPSLTAIREK